ncbi:MAG: hypothetical protein HKN82_18020 [Akkermansiaceae bacterium]|nr:hypothetical protein [Akkermansiaceae bacterium]NNM29364.1 hypothetical protein [Akkermansiaceae bacterium]
MDNYQTIHQFLQAFAPEISGRSTDAVTPDLEKDIKNFAAGNLTDEQVSDLSRELLANENAMERLASLLRN